MELTDTCVILNWISGVLIWTANLVVLFSQLGPTLTAFPDAEALTVKLHYRGINNAQ